MALIFRQTRRLLNGNIAATWVAQVREESGLPPLKTEKLDKTMELRSVKETEDGERPLAVLFGWLLAKKRHINKYGNLYLSKGFDVLTVQVPPRNVLRPKQSQERMESLLSILQDSTLASRPLLMHGFSMGGYLYGELLVKLETQTDRYADVCQRMVGQVLDSPVEFDGVSRGFANILGKNDLSKAALRSCFDLYLRAFHKPVTSHYIRASEAFHNNMLRLPSLFLYSRADPIGVADAVENLMVKWRADRIAVSHKCWDRSPHVSHFHHHPDEYVEALIAFLDSVGFSTPEDQEREREKDVQQPLFHMPQSGEKRKEKQAGAANRG